MNIHSRFYHGDAFRIVRGASGHADKAVFVFQCYLDDSGTTGLPIITLAGFVAPLKIWEGIEPLVNAVMDNYGVPIFHAKEFHDTKGCFAGWSRIKKHSFIKELFLPLKGRMLAVSMTVRKAPFVEAQKTQGKHLNMSPYGVCFSAIMTGLMLNDQIGKVIKTDGISFLVESGNNNNSGIEKFFHKTSKEAVFEGCLRSLTFISKESCRAIQLADYWAFYSRRFAREVDRFDGKLAMPTNFYLEVIHRNFPVWEQAVKDFPGEPAGRLSQMKNFDDFTAMKEAARKRP